MRLRRTQLHAGFAVAELCELGMSWTLAEAITYAFDEQRVRRPREYLCLAHSLMLDSRIGQALRKIEEREVVNEA